MHAPQVTSPAYAGSDLRTGRERLVDSKPRHARLGDWVPEAASSAHERSVVAKKKPLWKKILLGIVLLVLALAVTAGAYGAWFFHQLDSELEQADKDAQPEGASVLAPYESGHPYYVLLLGSDSRKGTSVKKDQVADGVYSQRADVMMLVRVDAENRQLAMVSVPRDTRYVYPDGTVAKINDTYNSGAMATVQAVSELTGVPISYYAAVDFASFEAIIDALGGITVDVPADIKYRDALTGEMLYLEAGEQVLDGQHAQLFARARKEYGEDVRQSNNRQMIEAMIKAVFNRPVTDIPETVLGAASYLSTNMRSSDLIDTGLSFAFGSGELTFYSCTGPTDGDFDSAYGGTWYCYDNPEGWAKLMAVVDAGEDPSGIDVDNTAIIHS